MNVSDFTNETRGALFNFETVEKGGAWTNAESAYMMFKIDDELKNKDIEYSISVKLHTYGSKKLPSRSIYLSAVGDFPESTPSEIRATVNDDRVQRFVLPLKDVVASNYYASVSYTHLTLPTKA